MLTDVLKTDHGKAHFKRIKQKCSLKKETQVSDQVKRCGNNKEEPSVCRDKTPGLKSVNGDTNENTTSKWNRRTSTLSSQR